MSNEFATKELLAQFTRQIPARPSFIASAEDLCAVCVRQLEKDEQCGDWLVEIIVQLYNRNTDEGCAPDRWEAAWFHFTRVLRESFWDYIDKFCPDPELVHQAVASLKLQLPPELQGLFEEASWYENPPGTLASIATNDEMERDLGLKSGG